jgi:hypothetical protein
MLVDEWLVRETGEHHRTERTRSSQREERRGVNDSCESVPGQTSTEMDAIDMSGFRLW